MTKSESKSVTTKFKIQRTEVIVGLLIIFFAFLMSVMQITNSNLNDKMMIAYNKLISYTNWYQSKSIKKSLKEGEVNYYDALLLSNTIPEKNRHKIKSKIAASKSLVLKYEAEKAEILIGSSNIPKEYWAQDINRELGKITGINQWESTTIKYDQAINRFDISILFFQVGIILGAVCIITYGHTNIQKALLICMFLFGILGICIALNGYMLIP